MKKKKKQKNNAGVNAPGAESGKNMPNAKAVNKAQSAKNAGSTEKTVQAKKGTEAAGEKMPVKKRDWYLIAMIVNALFFFALHMTFVGFTNDDAYFAVIFGGKEGLIPLLTERYMTESTRVLSEALLILFVRSPFLLWQLCDTLICVLVCHAACVLLVHDRHDIRNLWVFLFFAVYPYMHMGSAGWMCTSLNYIWPTAALLYSLSLCSRRLRGEKVLWWQYVCGVGAMLFAANCQQTAAALFLASALIAFWRMRDAVPEKGLEDAMSEKRVLAAGYEIAGMWIAIAGMVFALKAPGTAARTAMEVENWMPEFYDLNILDKFRLCSVFVFEHFVQIPDVTFFLFSLLLFFAGRDVMKKKWVAAIPLAIDVIFTAAWFVPVFLIGHRTNYDFTIPSIWLSDVRTALVQIAEILGLYGYIIAALVILFQTIRNLRERLAMVWALGIGFAARMVLMLSPVMFAAWHRTLILMYFAMLGDSVVLLRYAQQKGRKRMVTAVTAAGILVNLILTVGRQIRKAGM